MIARTLWLLLNAAQAAGLALWSAWWISAALPIRFLAGTDTALLMARQIWAPGLLLGAGACLDVRDAGRVDRRQCYLVAANHRSLIDIPVLFRALPHALRFVAKPELKRIPFLSWYMSATGMVFVERRLRSTSTNVSRVASLLAARRTVVTFPEGGRSRGPRPRSFKGVALLPAIEAQVPVVPIAVEGSDKVLPPGGFAVRPGRIGVSIGPPIETAGLVAEDRQRLARRVNCCVSTMFAELRERRKN